MSELLSPAGTVEAYKAAIRNGANAIYLGLDKFSARAYATNFTLDNLKELLDYAHLRNVKIYVTVNTIVYDKELKEVYSTIDALASMGVDAIIVQDLAILSYIVSHYKSIEAHASTQMGIDDIEGASLIKELGATRIVFARETPIDTIKDIKDRLDIEVEAFIHGALCLSYSGNCYMSSMIGERSGNRGRCAGCCRKQYTLIEDNVKELNKGYLLSMKDLNVINRLDDMSFIDSLKIEGRMKEPSYVALVTRTYKQALDKLEHDPKILDKVFNRTYTEGFMFGNTSKDITNIEKPNNYGYPIGKVIRQQGNMIHMELYDTLRKGDQIRIEGLHNKEEIILPIIKLYNKRNEDVIKENTYGVISSLKRVKNSATIYKIKNIENEKALDEEIFNKLPIIMFFEAKEGEPLLLMVDYEDIHVEVKSDFKAESAITSSTSNDNIIKQLSKLGDTPYTLNKFNINVSGNLFIPLKAINELRREAIAKLDEIRLYREVVKVDNPKEIKPIQNKSFDEPIISIEVSNEEQYRVVKELGIENIYYKNVIRRNNANYNDEYSDVLVGGLGGVSHYRNKNINIVSDSSLNVVNHQSVALLSSLGVNRITLSPEINKETIKELFNSYIHQYQTYPDLELIVYGRTKVMHSKYCPLKRLGMCGNCKKHNYELKDDYASFPILFNDDCTTTLLNSKTLNIMDDISDLKDIIHSYRVVFTTEDKDEIIKVINHLADKLYNNSKNKTFDSNNHTRGHFIKNPL